MKVPVWLALAAWPGWAHMMSGSSGDLTLDGARDPALPPAHPDGDGGGGIRGRFHSDAGRLGAAPVFWRRWY
jgi:hypothetical protein